jgi:hypothetical protein
LISVIGGAGRRRVGRRVGNLAFLARLRQRAAQHQDMPGMRPPLAFVRFSTTLLGATRWYFYIAYFFELIDTRSQISVAFINNFLSSLTACVIFRATRDYFSEKAALLAAGARHLPRLHRVERADHQGAVADLPGDLRLLPDLDSNSRSPLVSAGACVAAGSGHVLDAFYIGYVMVAPRRSCSSARARNPQDGRA